MNSSNYFCNYNKINVYNKKSIKSDLVTQILYGEKFKIISKYGNWYKIKLHTDNYVGFIIKKKFAHTFKPTHKISGLKSIIYRHPKNFTKFLGYLKILAFKLIILCVGLNFSV